MEKDFHAHSTRRKGSNPVASLQLSLLASLQYSALSRVSS